MSAEILASVTKALNSFKNMLLQKTQFRNLYKNIKYI